MMKNKYKKIKDLEDLQFEKQRLKLKIAKTEKKIVNRFKSIKNEVTPSIILSEVLSRFDINSDYISLLLPLALKLKNSIFNFRTLKSVFNRSGKKWIILSLLAAGTTAGIYYWWRKRAQSRANSEDDDFDEFDNDYSY